jgi:hypothetical protein
VLRIDGDIVSYPKKETGINSTYTKTKSQFFMYHCHSFPKILNSTWHNFYLFIAISPLHRNTANSS